MTFTVKKNSRITLGASSNLDKDKDLICTICFNVEENNYATDMREFVTKPIKFVDVDITKEQARQIINLLTSIIS